MDSGPASALMPDLSTYARDGMLDFRPKKVAPDVNAAFRSCAKEADTDDVLLKVQVKSLRPLCRLDMPAFEMIQLPDLTEEYEDFPKEFVHELGAQSGS